MLKTISLQALQFAINQAMGLDPSISEKLLALDQKVIEMVVSPLNVHFYICILKGQFILKSSWHQKPDTIIYSNPMGLIRLSIFVYNCLIWLILLIFKKSRHFSYILNREKKL